MELFVARQPILDRSLRVLGYELLLHTPGRIGTGPALPAAMVADGLLSVGLDTLVGDHLAFVRVDDIDVLDDFARLLPPGRVVLGLDGKACADPGRLEQCRELRRQGYALAADRPPRDVPGAWLREFDFVRALVDECDATATERGPQRAGRPSYVALGVDTQDVLMAATAAGFSLFQGRCFGRPSSRRMAERLSPAWDRLGVMAAVSRPAVTLFELEALVKADAGLSLLLLRAANSAACAVRGRVQTIRQALVLLGRDVVQHWLALWLVRAIAREAHAEQLTSATVRAHCCEALARTVGYDGGFLVGLCSALDDLLQQPMETILDHVPLAPEIHAALLGEPNSYRYLLNSVVAYERGDWDRCRCEAASIGADLSVVPLAYAKGLSWAGSNRAA